MANQSVTFEAAGLTYEIRFTQNAFYYLEEKLGDSTLALRNRFGRRETQIAMWAALEGARLKHDPPVRPAFSMHEVGDLIDEIGFDAALSLVVNAFAMAKPKPRESETPADEAKNA